MVTCGQVFTYTEPRVEPHCAQYMLRDGTGAQGLLLRGVCGVRTKCHGLKPTMYGARSGPREYSYACTLNMVTHTTAFSPASLVISAISRLSPYVSLFISKETGMLGVLYGARSSQSATHMSNNATRFHNNRNAISLYICAEEHR